MPTIDDVYGSGDTLKASHLPQGVPVPVTINRVRPKQFDDGGKLELAFVGKQRVLLCNKTNAGLIASYLGSRDYATWSGKVIFLRATTTDFKGEMVPCIRVDTDPPAEAAARQQPAPAPMVGADAQF